MTMRTTIAAAAAALALLTVSGCAFGKSAASPPLTDTAITSSVKARFVDNKDVDTSSIRVETLNGTVMLSGSARNAMEKSTAEAIAMKVNGVKSVKNEIAVRP